MVKEVIIITIIFISIIIVFIITILRLAWFPKNATVSHNLRLPIAFDIWNNVHINAFSLKFGYHLYNNEIPLYRPTNVDNSGTLSAIHNMNIAITV